MYNVYSLLLGCYCYCIFLLCRYLFKPKKAIMADLEEMVREQDSEMKKAKSTKENLLAAQESLIKELQELQK